MRYLLKYRVTITLLCVLAFIGGCVLLPIVLDTSMEDPMEVADVTDVSKIAIPFTATRMIHPYTNGMALAYKDYFEKLAYKVIDAPGVVSSKGGLDSRRNNGSAISIRTSYLPSSKRWEKFDQKADDPDSANALMVISAQIREERMQSLFGSLERKLLEKVKVNIYNRKGKIIYSKVFTPTLGSRSKGVIEELKAQGRAVISAMEGKELPKEEWPGVKLEGWELAESTFPELEKIFRGNRQFPIELPLNVTPQAE